MQTYILKLMGTLSQEQTFLPETEHEALAEHEQTAANQVQQKQRLRQRSQGL